MSDKRVKVIGYAKREFYNNNIEYRNFSDDLVGNQFTSDGGSTLFTLGNFRVTTNLDNRLTKNYRTNTFSKYYSLNKLKIDNDKVLLGLTESKMMKLNLDKTNLSNYAYFGSLREYIRVSLENIIKKWPASLYVFKENQLTPLNEHLTYESYSYDDIRDEAQFIVDIGNIKNDFEINLKQGGSHFNTYNKGNKSRNMHYSHSDYVVSVNGVDYEIIGFSGYTNGTKISFTVKGNPFIGTGNINYHIKPKNEKINQFYFNLNDFESHLLNRDTTPYYKAEFKYTHETENGVKIHGKKVVTWPVSDGYNIDFKSNRYVDYVGDLLEIAENNDKFKSNIITNRLVSNSIIEFDTIDGKMDKTLKIYGRNFDELKTYIDGIQFINHVSYDKKNNIPDRLVKNLARTMGWELTTSLFNIDFNEDFLSTSGSLNLSPVESEVEFWRRLILNSPWVWKSKGTRKVIEFLLRFVGTPKGLVSFNEFVYKAKNTLNLDDLRSVFDELGIPFNEEDILVDSEGFPKAVATKNDMYYQKGGQWYRQTSGNESNIDVIKGNNPHIGPYDAGFEYINQYNEIIPDFRSVIINNEKKFTTVDQTFMNYDKGRFNKFFENDVRATVDLNVNFENIYNTELSKCAGKFDVNECTVTNTWSLETYISNELTSNNSFFSSNDGSIPGVSDYTSALESVKTALSLNSIIEDNIFYLVEDIVNCGDASDLDGKKIEFRVTLEFSYTCAEEIDCGPMVIDGYDTNKMVLFQNNANNTVPSEECCLGLGFSAQISQTGYNCYDDTEPITFNTDIYAFLDSTSMTYDDAVVAKAGLIEWYNRYAAREPNYNGNIYILGVTDEKWLDWPNKVYNGQIQLANYGNWSNLHKLPANLNTQSWVPPTELMVIVIGDESATDYNTGVLSDGLSGEPTNHFINNYKTLAGNIKNNFDFFKGAILPLISDTNGKSASLILSTVAAIEGVKLTDHEIKELDTPVNLNVLKTNNPYENYPIPNSSPQSYLRPLKEFNWSAIYNRATPAVEVFTGEQFIKDLNKLLIINENNNIYTVDSTYIDASETGVNT